jgi:hypothetical protein
MNKEIQMSFTELFHMYVAFMESSDLRHTDLVQPIREYAQHVQESSVHILNTLQSLYVRA